MLIKVFECAKAHHHLGVETMLGLFKKKPSLSMPELPPPPSPPDFSKPVGDIPAIQASDAIEGPEELPAPGEMPEFPSFESRPGGMEMPELPSAPEREEQPELPEAPLPELPEAPTPDGMEPVESRGPFTVEEPTLEPSGRVETVRRPVGPAFVSVDEYRSILENSNRVRAKLVEAEEFVRRLNEIKAEEENAFEKWRVQLEDIERKLAHVDKVIAKAKR